MAEMTFEFLMSEKPLHVKMSLSKEVSPDQVSLRTTRTVTKLTFS